MRPPVILNVVFAVITYTWSCSTTKPSCACITGRIVLLPRTSKSKRSRPESRCWTTIKAAPHSPRRADSSSETASESPAEEATATIVDVSITAHAALRGFSTQHCANVGRRKDRQVRANFRAQFEPGKFLRKQTPNLRRRCTATVAQRTHRTLVSHGFFAWFKK